MHEPGKSDDLGWYSYEFDLYHATIEFSPLQYFSHYVIWQTMTAVQSYSYPIGSYQTDASGHLFNHQLFNLLQDAAHKHADGNGFGQRQLVPQNLFWVLSRLTLEIVKLPEIGDHVVLSTWVKSKYGVVSEREFSVSIDDTIVINASSLWFSLSGDEHKPTRLPEMYSEQMIIHDVYATKEGTRKVLGVHSDTQSVIKEMIVQYSDIDMVEHVNNAAYVRWIMDELHDKPPFKKQLINMDINYLGECFLGDMVKVYHSAKTETNLIHEVANNYTGKVICRANTIWQ